MSEANHLHNLNPPQIEAVKHFEGPILVLAGAGTGKTRILTRRIVHLIQEHHVSPNSILAVTFTNKACNEMRERIHSMLGTVAEQIWISTFHSAGLKILRRHYKLLGYKDNFVVYDDDDSRALIKAILKEHHVKDSYVGAYQKAIDQAKNSYLSPEDLAKEPHFLEISPAEVYEKYQTKLFESNAMDFGDLLVNPVKLFNQTPQIAKLYQSNLRFLLVDEFQDTNYVQYLFLQHILGAHQNILVVGDDDQSIYAFRGANIENILNFEKDFPQTTVVKLEQNYRSTQNILEAAHAVISKNSRRKDKKIWSDAIQGSGIVTYVGDDEMSEAQFVAAEIKNHLENDVSPQDIAVFYRTNAQSRALEESLNLLKIPYRIYGGLKFYDRKEIKDILAYLRLLINPQDSQAFLRCINTPPRGIGAQTIEGLKQLASAEQITLLDATFNLANGSTRKAKELSKFAELIIEFKAKLETTSLPVLVEGLIKATGYEALLKKAGDHEATSRLENLRELVVVTKNYDDSNLSTTENLARFIDIVSLTAGSDKASQESTEGGKNGYVSLMTVHLAKGLEFEVVFFTGIEDGLIPHYRTLDKKIEIEEERRLCYVGITRAKKQLYLTRARTRGMFSAASSFGYSGFYRMPSRFAYDIPEHCLDQTNGEFLIEDYNPGEIADAAQEFVEELE